jgi:long-chain fatty acid transport protein
MKLKSRRVLLLLVTVGFVFSAGLCFGAGFALYEGSARGNALGGALVGRADDPSALFFNPAGITQLPGTQMMAGATFIMPKTDVTTRTPRGSITTTSESNVWMPPHLYLTYQATDKVWLGLAVFSPFGLGTEFNENWPGKYNSYKAVIQTVNVNPNIAFKVTDKLSLAAGLDLMYFDLTLKNKILTGFGDVDSSLKGDSVGVGMNFAAHYKACDWMRLGLSYRAQMQQNVTGDAKFTKPATFPSQLPYGLYFNSTTASGSITLPDELYFGAAFYPIKDLSLEVGGVWTHWNTYSALTVEYANPIIPGYPYSAYPQAVKTVTKVKEWNDVLRLFLGVEYKTTDWLDLRAGFVWDQEPSDNAYVDYLVPANDRYLFSFGPGFRWRNWTLDLSYTYLYIINRNNVPARAADGIYDSDFRNGYANMIGCSIGYKF